MDKFSIFLIYSGDSKAFTDTLNNAQEIIGFVERVNIFAVFKCEEYELESDLWEVLESTPKLKGIYSAEDKKINDLIEECVMEEEEGISIFLESGDILDKSVLRISSSYKNFADKCGAIFLGDNFSKEYDQNIKSNALIPIEEIIKFPIRTSGVAILNNDIFAHGLIGDNLQDAISRVLVLNIMHKGFYFHADKINYQPFKDEILNNVNLKMLLECYDYYKQKQIDMPIALQNLIYHSCLCRYENDNLETMQTLVGYLSYSFGDIMSLSENEKYIIKYLRGDGEKSSYNNFELNIVDASITEKNLKLICKMELPFYFNEGSITLKYEIENEIHFVPFYIEETGLLSENLVSEFSSIIDVEMKDLKENISFYICDGDSTKEINKISFLDKDKNKIDKNEHLYGNLRLEKLDKNNNFGVQIIAPRSEYLISCIVPIYNVEIYLREALESVVNQTIGFKENVQLILVNDGSPDNSELICLEYRHRFPQNVIYIKQENKRQGAARNHGLKYALGEFISFLDPDDYFDTKFFEAGIDFIRKNEVDLVAFRMKLFEKVKEDATHPLDFKFQKNMVVDVTTKHDYFVQSTIASTVVSSKAIESLQFDEILHSGEDLEFVHKIILKSMKYGVISDTFYYYRKRNLDNSTTQLNFGKPEYFEHQVQLYKILKEYSVELHGEVTRFTQHHIMYFMQWLRVKEIPAEVKEQLNIPQITAELSNILQYIDSDIIKVQNHISYWQKYYLLKLKYGNALLDTSSEPPTFYLGHYAFEKLNPIIYLSTVEESKNVIHIHGFYNLAHYDDINIIATYNGNEFDCLQSESRHKGAYFLGEMVHKSILFDFYIPVRSEGTIEFFIKVNNIGIYPVKVKNSHHSPMGDYKNSFVLGKSFIISRSSKSNKFIVRNITEKNLNTTLQIYLKDNFDKEEYKEDINFLNEYLKSYTMMRNRRIWVFMDRIENADDNAEHLYRYSIEKNDGIEKYFIIDKNSPHAERLKDLDNVLYYGSFLHRLMFLFAEKIIMSNFGFNYRYIFIDNKQQMLYRPLINSEYIYLNHGIIAGDLSNSLSRYNRNFRMFLTAGNKEYESILSNYGYDEKVVKLLGFPRYDKFYNNQKKNILIAFTWRNSLGYSQDGYIYNFKETEFCKIISAFLCDEKLITAAKLFGYKLQFKPHPIYNIQISDFEMDEYVEVADPKASYHTILAEGDLLITDYSSIQFDFAYLRKPVLYYQFDKGNLEKGYFDYEKDNLGEVANTHTEIVDLIIEYMKNNCELKNIYRKRIEEFFTFSDKNNCQRVYDAIINLDKKVLVDDN